jgi:phosphoenolpyruvate---glycerone phosphotransferase subunit DhaL
MNKETLKGVFGAISQTMEINKEYLIELDQQNGDGDLGISMSSGFRAASDFIKGTEETDLGKVFMKSSAVFNEAAPSSLGTILSFGMMGMAKALKGKEEASLAEITDAMDKGLALIMEKAKSKPGEKTVLDALVPAVEALKTYSHSTAALAFSAAAKAAEEGSASTKAMKPVHGRAVYYGDQGIGLLDGGSVAGKLIMESIADYLGGLE